MHTLFPGNVLGLSCFNCGLEREFAFPAYRCSCGGNLQVTYDIATIARTFSRPSPAQLALEGHFAYRQLLPLAAAGQAHFSLVVGGSQLVSRPDLADEAGVGSFHLKDDTRLPSASFKDRASSILLAMAAERGIKSVCTASTGNAGCSMACLCADSGQDAFVFVPESAPRAKVAQLLFYGATVVKVQGNYDDAFDLCWEVSVRRGWLNRSTGWNPFTREGKKTVSFEIAQQLGWKAPDVVFVPVGDGNIISGVWKGFCELHELGVLDRRPAMVSVQSDQSNAVSLAVGRVLGGQSPVDAVRPVKATTLADSISVDLPRDGVAAVRAVVESGGEAVQVTDDEIKRALVQLSSGAGVFAEPAGAAAFAGFNKWSRTGGNRGDLDVVCLVTGNGLKDVGAAADHVGQPIVVPADVDEVLGRLGE